MASKIPSSPADVELQLTTAIAIGATTFSVSSANDDDGVALPSAIYCFTIDNGSSNKEYLMGLLNGVNVTAVKSVSRQGVETTGAVRPHRVGSPCIITDFATIQRVAGALNGTVDLDGANPIGYDAEPSLADRKDLATVGYVLDLVTGGTVAFDNQTVAGVLAGETITAGQSVYLKESDQRWWLTDADTVATVDNVRLGIALGSGSAGVAITGGVLLEGVRTTTGLTAGSRYYLGNTAGALTTTAGTNAMIVGLALSTTRLLFSPSRFSIPTAAEKAALAGDGGTPGTNNPYVLKNKTKTAGSTINGALLPVPVYQNKTDNEFYACDANDTNAMKFLGFATSNSTDGNVINVQFTGIVNGFSGLQEGEKYYVQDTLGTIGTTIGTYEILVGVAISETELLIQKGKRRHSGALNIASVTTTTTITCGFRLSTLRLKAFNVTGSSTNLSFLYHGVFTNGVLTGISLLDVGIFSYTEISNRLYDNNNLPAVYMTFSVSNITDTTFDIVYTETGAYDQGGTILWEAEGEL